MASGSDVHFPLPSPFALAAIGFFACICLAAFAYIARELYVIRAVQEQIDAYVVQVPCESNHATGANAVKLMHRSALSPKQ